MYNANIPSNDELPSTTKLIKSTVLALIGATILLVTVVMPAEYNIDPTGIGKALGLTHMGEIKQSLHDEAEADAKAHSVVIEQDAHGSESHSHNDEHHHNEEKEHSHDKHSHEPKGHHHGDGKYHRH